MLYNAHLIQPDGQFQVMPFHSRSELMAKRQAVWFLNNDVSRPEKVEIYVDGSETPIYTKGKSLTVEQFAKVLVEVETKTRIGANGQLKRVAELLEKSLREVQAFAKKHAVEIGKALGKKVEYRASDYDASGRGAFGRLGGGRKAHYSPAHLYVE